MNTKRHHSNKASSSFSLRFLALLCLLVCLAFPVLFHSQAQAQITASFPALTLIVKELAPPDKTLTTLALSGEAAHHFELTPKTLVKLQQQDLIVMNGLGFEHWLPKIEGQAQLKPKILIASKGVKVRFTSGQTPDPHAWFDPDNLMLYAQNIHQGLLKQYPEQEKLLLQRLKEFQRKHHEWKTQFRSETEKWASPPATGKWPSPPATRKGPSPLTIVTAHASYHYLAEAFGLRAIALLGSHDGESLTPRQLTQKLREIKSIPHRVFFGEDPASDTLMKEWAQKTASPWGGTLFGDSPKASPDGALPLTLFEYLEHNQRTLSEAYKKLIENK